MPDIIIGKRGDTLSGRVLTERFELESAFGNLTISKDEIWRIHVDTGHSSGPDQIVLKTADSQYGTLVTDPVDFRREAGGELSIPKSAIHTVHMGMLFDKEAPSLLDAG